MTGLAPAIVRVSSVTKRFAGHTAVRDLSLEVPRGAIYGLLGPNGAGKTTTIRMIMNILIPDDGDIMLFGEPGTGRDHSRRIGYLPEERGLYRKMKVVDLLVFLAEIKGVAHRVARSEALRWLDRLGLADWAEKKVDALSRGMQQKLQFISTVLHGPELLILDEPFAGLDPINTQIMKDAVVELARRGATVLFSTHIMEQAEKLCDAVCIIARGRKVVDGPLAAVKRDHDGRHVIVAVERGDEALDRVLADPALVAKADHYGQYAELTLAHGADAQRLLRAVLATGVSLTRFEVTEPTLNQIFIAKVGPEAAEAAAGQEAGDA